MYSRSYSQFISKTPLKNFEILKTFGGNPFVLRHEVPEGVHNVFVKKLNLPK